MRLPILALAGLLPVMGCESTQPPPRKRSAPAAMKVPPSFREAPRLALGQTIELEAASSPHRLRLMAPPRSKIVLRVEPAGDVWRIEVRRILPDGREVHNGYTSFHCAEPGCRYGEDFRTTGKETLVEVTVHPSTALRLTLASAPGADLRGRRP